MPRTPYIRPAGLAGFSNLNLSRLGLDQIRRNLPNYGIPQDLVGAVRDETAAAEHDAQVTEGAQPLIPLVFTPTPDPGSSSPRAGKPSFNFQDFWSRSLIKQDVQIVLDEIDIEFQPSTMANALVVNRKLTRDTFDTFVPGYGASFLTPLAATIKAFMLLRYIPFDTPFPIINTTSPYQWIRDSSWLGFKNKYRVFLGQGMTANHGFYTDLRIDGAFHPDDLLYLAGNILHESRHGIAGGAKIHNCNSLWTENLFHSGVRNEVGLPRNDWELGDGACAMDYWFVVWCRDHVPNDFWLTDYTGLTPEAPDNLLKYFDRQINICWLAYFCSHYGRLDANYNIGAPPRTPQQASGPRPAGDALVGSMPTALYDLNYRPTYGVPMYSDAALAPLKNPAVQQRLVQQTGVSWPTLRNFIYTI